MPAALFDEMITAWGWPMRDDSKDDDSGKIGLHNVAANTYQLYTYQKASETKTYERFGKAHIVVVAQ